MPTLSQLDAWLAHRPEPRYVATRRTEPALFAVSFTRPDGTGAAYTRHGGTSTQHAQEAMELAGLGATITVNPMGGGL